MRRHFAVMAAVLAGVGAAEARPDVRQIACAKVNAMIRDEGAVVMTTGTHTFQRFVASRSRCQRDQRLRTVFLATADDQRCRVNGICEQALFNDMLGFGD